MKQIMLLLMLVSLAITAKPIVIHSKNIPPKENTEISTQVAATPNLENGDVEAQVVLANVATMLGCLGVLSTDPKNPAIVGPNLAQIGISFLNIIAQIFKSHGIDEEETCLRVAEWFMHLTDETKLEIVELFLNHADQVRSLQHCSQSIL